MDSVADFLTRIRNAGLAKHEKVDVPSSNLRVGIAQTLEQSGYIRSFRVARDNKQGLMRVYLRYNEKGEHVIKKLQRVSTPGRRKYVRSTEIPKVRSGFGLAVLSTSKGVLTGEAATEKKIGGEWLFQVW